MALNWVDGGSITSPLGFCAGASYTQIKSYGPEPRYDVGLLVSEAPCTTAGLFTRNKICGAPVKLCRERLERGEAQALVVNSGCSNVALGEQGLLDARRMAQLAAERAGLPEHSVLVASTGVIGQRLPMEKIAQGIGRLELTRSGGELFSRAMMTTDTRPKLAALRFEYAGRVYTLGGAAKGAGMAHPDMATVLCFLTTDAPVERSWWQGLLKNACDQSINMIDVDMDTSTSDTMLALANGAAGGDPISTGHPAAAQLREAVFALAVAFAKELARDAEGARTLIEVQVSGARHLADARIAARTIASSPLVKTMVTGRDPNLGRVLMAVGRSGAELVEERLSVWLGDVCAFERGEPVPGQEQALATAMDAAEVRVRVELDLGDASACAWGCDLTEEYVRINADYTT